MSLIFRQILIAFVFTALTSACTHKHEDPPSSAGGSDKSGKGSDILGIQSLSDLEIPLDFQAQCKAFIRVAANEATEIDNVLMAIEKLQAKSVKSKNNQDLETLVFPFLKVVKIDSGNDSLNKSLISNTSKEVNYYNFTTPIQYKSVKKEHHQLLLKAAILCENNKWIKRFVESQKSSTGVLTKVSCQTNEPENFEGQYFVKCYYGEENYHYSKLYRELKDKKLVELAKTQNHLAITNLLNYAMMHDKFKSAEYLAKIWLQQKPEKMDLILAKEDLLRAPIFLCRKADPIKYLDYFSKLVSLSENKWNQLRSGLRFNYCEDLGAKFYRYYLQGELDIKQALLFSIDAWVVNNDLLHEAAKKGDLKTLKALLKLDLSPNEYGKKKEYFNYTPLHIAVIHQQMAVIKFLTE
ncbi:MAG: ankyrin repeat domain-containing protein, partial [Bdellovibrionales bacterium]|nr:ankyrin repeat domain-containing protein [Bdellovibrionales bacterium]